MPRLRLAAAPMVAAAVLAPGAGRADAPLPPPVAPASPAAIYVRADGDDAAPGLAADHPVRTLDRARDLARALPAPRVVYLSGTFRPAAPLLLFAADSGTSWSGDATARIDGGGRLPAAIIGYHLHDARFSGFAIENTVADGLRLTDPARITIAAMQFRAIRSQRWSQAAIDLIGEIGAVTVAGNTVADAGYAGIYAYADGAASIRDLAITGNQLLRTCQAVADCGAIYVNGRGRSQSATITRNVVIDFGPRGGRTKAIYLDDWASGIAVTGNCIAGPGDFAFQIHGGAGNRIAGNAVDAAGTRGVLLYQSVAGPPRQPMRGNVLSGNRIVHAPPGGLVVREQVGPGADPAQADNRIGSGPLECRWPLPDPAPGG